MTPDDALSAELLRSVLDELPLGVRVACAPSGEVVYANRISAELLGTREGASLQDHQGRPLPPEALPFERAMRERTPVIVEDLVVVSGGTCRHLHARAQPLIDGRGVITHVVSVFADVSAQVAAELDSKRSRERLSVALHHAPIMLYTTDRDGIVTLADGAGMRALGLRPGETVGLSAFHLYRDNPEVADNLRRALRGDSFTTVTHLGGTTLESWIGPIRDASNEVQGLIGVSTDITERRRLERKVAHADRISALGRLAASVAHEINNPLTYTLEALRLCEERACALPTLDGAAAETVRELRELLHDAAEGAERVRLITRDLTEFASPDSDTGRSVALDAAALSASKLVAKRSASKGDVVLDLACGGYVRADEHRLVQVFVNLILNAADALPTHTRELQRIRVSTRAEQGYAIAEVADSGPGMSDIARAHLFEPFYTTKPAGEGTGLGLYVTHSIVASLGGTIEALTAPEGGALLRFRLPLTGAVESEPPLAPVTIPEPRDRSAQSSTAARPPRVMVIDDEAVLAQLFAMTLADECDVDVFESGREAFEKLVAGGRYDLVFCDLMMRDLSGMELYELLAARAPGREHELIFMTGGTFDPAVSQFVARIANPCITKPFDIRAEVRRRIVRRLKPRS